MTTTLALAARLRGLDDDALVAALHHRTYRRQGVADYFDLGEALRVVLLSVTEGEDKPLKYPTIFNSADVAVITKMDLATAVEFNQPAALANIQAVRPGIKVFEVSAKSGQGMEDFFSYLAACRAELKATEHVESKS